MGKDARYDFIAIGLGPFNLSLACLMQPLREHRGLFLEKNDGFRWHPGMLLPDACLQNPFLADLVSLADPTSAFSYLNYRKQQGTLHTFFIRENFYLTREEFNRYGQWAAARLESLRFRHEVRSVQHDAQTGEYLVSGIDGATGAGFAHRCQRLVIGIGAEPVFPACCPAGPDRVHSANYLAHKRRLQAKGSITVVGSGQSAAEVVLDLLKESDLHGNTVHWITRSPRLFQMETGKLAVELITPDYAEHFFGLAPARKETILAGQRSLFNGINLRLVDAIYDRLDEKRSAGGRPAYLLANAELQAQRFDAERGCHELRFFHTAQQRSFVHRTDGLIFATGYAPRVPAFLEPVRERLRWDERGRYAQTRNYAVDLEGSEVFVQNAGMHGLGLGSPDLGLACHRNAVLIRALTGFEYYPVDARVAFQHFEAPTSTPWYDAAPPAAPSRPQAKAETSAPR